jgi:hypothetical protein
MRNPSTLNPLPRFAVRSRNFALYALITVCADSTMVTSAHAAGSVGILGTPGCTHATIADAIAAAGPGDVIVVRPGTYYENFGTISKNVRISSGNAFCSATATSGAIIDGGGAQIAKTMANVRFSNITLQNGAATNGGLLEVGSGTLTLNSAVLTNGVAESHGGCVYATGGAVNVIGASHFSNCEALSGNGGAIYGWFSDISITDDSVLEYNYAANEGGAVFSGLATLTIDGNATLQSNEAHGGGAICLFDSDAQIADYAQVGPDNVAERTGGGIAVQHSQGVSVLVEIMDNAAVIENEVTSALGMGGGIALLQDISSGFIYMTLAISDWAKVDGNEAEAGGGVYAVNGLITMTHWSSIEDNRANSGAGISMLSGSLEVNGGEFMRNIASTRAGGVYATDASVLLENSHFGGNLALNGDGGALFASGDGSDVTIDNEPQWCLALWLGTNDYCSSFVGNLASARGGAVFLGGGVADIDHTAFIGNLGNDGFAIFADQASLDADNVLIADNSGPTTAAAVATTDHMTLDHATVANNNGDAVRYKPGASGHVRHSIVWSNAGGLFLNFWSSATNNILQSVVGGVHSGTMPFNPQFVTNWRGDYRLGSTSPAIDAATSSIVLDLDRVIRPQGAANDLGAFEYF